MGFWHAYMGIEGGGGEAPATSPVDGWIAALQRRYVVASVQGRVWSVDR
jgi:hypothetical protein